MKFTSKIGIKPAYLLALLLLLLTQSAFAHKPSDSYLTMSVQAGTSEPGSNVSVRWDIALRDLDYVLQLDRDNDGALTWGEVRQRGEDITRYATTHLRVSSKDKPCTWQTAAPMMLDKHSDGTYAVLSLTAACGAPLADALQVNYSLLFDVDPSHRGLVQWLPPGAKEESKEALSVILGTESAMQSLPFQAPSAWQTFQQYVVEGVWHIWIGYDHILFLLSLLLPAVLILRTIDGVKQLQPAESFVGALKEVFKVVTAFTLAHSITLSLAALSVVSLPSRWIESAIAASIIVAALNNLRGAVDSKRWVMAFGFGLIHGFGFASVLADLGLPQNALITALVGFNVGIEGGQLAIVAVFLPVAFWLRATRFYQVQVFKWGSGLIALLALYWFVQRAFDL
ncbi:MAG: HupE/UreJ family protein [Burkholderiaceae bacterium]|nr:HupE/UreJ family protein [Burkholderiaceae bacterium]